MSPPGVLSTLEVGLISLSSQLDNDTGQFHLAFQKALSEELVAHGYADFARNLCERMESPPPPLKSSPNGVEKAIGAAVGRFFGSNPEETRLRLARQVLEIMPECQTALEGAAYNVLRQTPNTSLTLQSTLLDRATASANDPRRLVDMHLKDIEALRALRTGVSRLRDIWESRPYVPLFVVHDEWAFELLRRVDLRAYLRVLEELPYADFARQIIRNATWTTTADQLAELISIAPAVLDDDGALAVSVPLVMFALAMSIKRWFGEEPYHPKSPRNTLIKDAKTFETECPLLLKTLSKRPDYPALGYAWLQYLIWSVRTRRDHRVGSDRHPSAERWFALIQQLAGALPIHPAPCEWIQSEQSLWRNERIYALLAVLVFKPTNNQERIADLLKSCLTNEIVTTHAIQELQFDQQPCNFSIVALAVSSIKDLAGWFKDLWADIYLQRERARRIRLDPNGNSENVGLVAVFWAFAGLARLPADSPVRRSLWAELEVAVREGALTDAFHTAAEAWSVAARLLAAYWTLVFADDRAKGMAGSLDEFLLHWAEASGDFAFLVAELASRGVTAEMFSRSIDGELVRAAWKEANYLNQRIRKPLPAFDLKGLAIAIDAQRQAEAPAVGTVKKLFLCGLSSDFEI